MIKKIRIGLAEDHDMVRQSFVRVMRDYKDIDIVFEAKNGQELFHHLESRIIDIVLLDIEMPILDGKEAMVKLKTEFPEIKIIVVSAYAEDDLVLKYVKLGADGFLPKYAGIDQLMDAVYSTRKNGFYFEKPTLELLKKQELSPVGGLKKLTDREIVVLKFLCSKKNNKEIAEALKVKEVTIAGFKHRLFQKTKTNDIEGLYAYALKYRYLNGKR